MYEESTVATPDGKAKIRKFNNKCTYLQVRHPYHEDEPLPRLLDSPKQLSDHARDYPHFVRRPGVLTPSSSHRVSFPASGLTVREHGGVVSYVKN